MKHKFLFLSIFITVGLLVIILFDQVLMPVYTRHGAEYTMPDVTLKSQYEAIITLENEEMHPVISDSIFDENVPKGFVLQQNPLPFSKVKKGRNIYLTLSRGPQIKELPDFRGKTIREVRLRLQELNLTEGRIRYRESTRYPEGVVFEQHPEPGSSFSAGTFVTFTVSLGSSKADKRLPDLIGKNLVEAKRLLKNIKISNVKIVSQKDSTLLPGTVIAQSPYRGTPVIEVKQVTLTVSK